MNIGVSECGTPYAYAVGMQLSGIMNCDFCTLFVGKLCFVLQFRQYGRIVSIFVLATHGARAQIDCTSSTKIAVDTRVAFCGPYLYIFVLGHVCFTI